MFKPAVTLTVNNAKSTLEAGLHAIASGQTDIDFAGVTVVDSAAVATLLVWQRAALAKGVAVTFSRLPANLHSLAELYGVQSLLQVSTPAAARADLPHH